MSEVTYKNGSAHYIAAWGFARSDIGFKSIRLLISLLLLAPSVTQISRSFPAPSSVEGVVVDRITGAAISGAVVELDGIVNTRVEQRTITTARDGTFTFLNVPPASYWLIASVPGVPSRYVPTVWGQRGFTGPGTQFTVEEEKKIQDVRLRLVPTGTISGKATDSSGRPQANISVSLVSPAFIRRSETQLENSQVRWGYADSSLVAEVKTNDRGEFRFDGVTPGQYYLAAEALQLDLPVPLDVNRYIKKKVEMTYFPGVTDPSKAAPVDLKAGASVGGLDFVITRFAFRTVHGTVTDEIGKIIKNATVLIIPVDAFESRLANLQTASKGTFDFRYVEPNTYFAFAYVESVTPSLFGRTRFEVGTQNVDNLTIRVRPRFELKGRVVLEGDAKLINDRAQVLAALQPEPPSDTGTFPGHVVPVFSAMHPQDLLRRVTVPSSAQQPPTPYILSIPRVEASFEDDGAMRFPNLMPWDYAIETKTGLPNSFVKSVKLGGVDVRKEGIHLDATPRESLEIVISSGAGSVTGRVIAESSPVTDGFRVVLVPDDIDRRDLYSTVWTDKSGRYQLENITPGNYTLYCWDFVRDGAWTDANFLRLYEGKGTPLHVSERSIQSLDIHLIPEWY